MLRTAHSRDLVMIGAVFGLAAFVWPGWAQESPPTGWVWRAVLAVLLVAGLVLSALSIPTAIRYWRTSTAIDPAGRAFRAYIVVVVIEVVIAAAAGFGAVTAGRSDLIAPLILAVVGIHFVALVFVFDQPVLHLAAALLIVVAVVAVLASTSAAAPSFWCGLLGAPILFVFGAWCHVVGSEALRVGIPRGAS